MSRRTWWILILVRAVILTAVCWAWHVYAQDRSLDLPVEPGVTWDDPPKVGQHKTVSVPPAPPKPPTPTAPLPPPEVPPSFYGRDLQSTSGSVIYVLDRSGSMDLTDGQSESRLRRAQTATCGSLRTLPRNFEFNVLAYDCSTSYFYSGQGLQKAEPDKVAQACAWIEGLTAGSGTGTGPAVVWALLYRSNKLLVVLTDGAPNCGAGSGFDADPACLEAHLSQARWSNTQRARIDVFAIRATGSFQAFCRRLAAESGGSCTDVR